MKHCDKPTYLWKEAADICGCGGAKNPPAAARARVKRWNTAFPEALVLHTRNVVDAETFHAAMSREFDLRTSGADVARSIRRAAAKRAQGGGE